MKFAFLRGLASVCLATALCLPSPLLLVVVKADTPAKTITLPPGVTRVTSVEGITEYRLENGLRVLLFPDESKQTITVNITYLVGSRHENYGETGMAHLLEHLVFKGTPRHPDIPKELTERGARPNGTTWLDRTNYFETFQATEDNLRWALDLEADRMVNSFIAKKDLDSEMTVVRNEFEAGENSPYRVLLQRTHAVAYDWHNYGNSTIGARADIENVPIERLQAFYRKYYQPDNAVLLVAGKFDEEKTLKMIHEYFGPIPKPTRVLEPTYTLEPTQDGERTLTIRRVGDTKVILVCYHVPAAAHPDKPAVQLLAGVIGDTPSGRLHKALVETKKPPLCRASASIPKSRGWSILRPFYRPVLTSKPSVRPCWRPLKKLPAASRRRLKKWNASGGSTWSASNRPSTTPSGWGWNSASGLLLATGGSFSSIGTGSRPSRLKTYNGWPEPTSSPTTGRLACSFRLTSPTGPKSRRRRTSRRFWLITKEVRLLLPVKPLTPPRKTSKRDPSCPKPRVVYRWCCCRKRPVAIR